MADKTNEQLKEQIKYEMEVLKFIALVMVALGGGAISLFLGTPTALRFGLAGLGFFATLALGSVYTNAHHANRGYMTTAEWLALGISAAILTTIVVTLWKIARP